MAGKIIVIGSLNMDLVVFTPRFPKIGETILGSSFSTFCGGKGANQAVAMARLGADVQMIGKIGKDEFGQTLLENLTANQVQTESVLEAEAQSGTAIITVDALGQNTIVVIPGANRELKPEDIYCLRETIQHSDYLVMQLEIPMETVVAAAKLAYESGVKIIVNPAPASDLPDDLYPLVDYLIPNESELSILSNLPVTTIEEVKAACAVLLQRGIKNLVVTMGEQGVFYRGEDQEISISAYPVQPVDTTAAGDAFIGGFVTALAAGLPIQTILNRASASGAISVTRQGAQTSLPYDHEVDQFLKVR
ncbi:MAG: ribokinase [Anaerolineaceae bacterium]|nr:ribokinase [Anaerolineaceae bacterium]